MHGIVLKIFLALNGQKCDGFLVSNTHRLKILFCGLTSAAFLGGGASVLALDSPALSLARQLNEAFIEVADKVSPAVVVIEVTEKPSNNSDQESWWGLLPPEDRPYHHRGDRGPVQGEASGIVISADGYILTNNHVVENADKIQVRFKDGHIYTAEVTGTDPLSDVAVIKIKAKGLTAATLGDSDSTRVGEFVLAIGAPFALSYSVTFGHVSAKGRSFEKGFADQDFIQTDASINPGNSGGPLVNLYGEVIAINTMIEGMNTGIGFAVPINLAKRVKDHLIAEGKFTRSWIGVGIEELNEYREDKDPDRKLAPGIDNGVVLTGVKSGGAAAKAGLHPMDVVVAVEGKTIKTERELKDSIALQPAGHVLAFKVIRGKEHLSIKVTTEAMPEEVGLVEARPQPARYLPFGLNVEPLSQDLADQYGVKPGSGVIVTYVDGDSPADAKGIQPGDIITEINHQPVTSRRQFHQALRGADAKKGITFNVISNGSSRLVILQDNDR